MDKPLQIAFKNMPTSAALEALIRDKVDRLHRLSDRIVGCRVVVEIPHRGPQSGKVPLGISVEVEMPGRPKLIAKEQEERRDTKEDEYVFVSRAFEAIERQIRSAATLSTERRHGEDGHDLTTGVVVQLFPEQSYGFIEVRQSPELYFTRNAVVDGNFDDLAVGSMVHVTIASGEGPMGPQASSVHLLRHRKSPA